MSILVNESWGIAFLAIAMALVLLMYRVWGYPYDEVMQRSTAPASLVWTHRLLGYLYVAIYVVLMWQMVPRLWTYQVELPARTVAHLVLGLTIGGLLLIKLSIVRFFKHMEAQLVPFLGTALFLCTLVLVLLALPLALREAFLRDLATQGDMFSDERLERVRSQLPKTGLDDKVLLAELVTSDGLLAGRHVLTRKCVQCHDLRTVLARPRTPDSWRQTVKRMASRATVLHPISEEEQWQVTAYLIAISPTLQRSLIQKRSLDLAVAESQMAVMEAGKRAESGAMDESFDLAAAEQLFQTRCSQCHASVLVAAKPPGTKEQAVQLVTRMVRNGLMATDQELETIIRYLSETYAKKAPESAGSGSGEPAAAVAQQRGTQSEAAQVELVVRPFGNELRFDMPEITAEAGKRVRLVLENTTSTGGLVHNFVLLRDASLVDDVINAAFAAAATGFAPQHETVIATIPAVSPGSQGSVTFVMPPPGQYTYLCMMPGHSITMRGTLHSVE